MKKRKEKYKLLFISPWYINNFSLKKYDLKSFESKYNIELHDLGIFINQKFTKTFIQKNNLKYKTYRFKSIWEWIQRLLIIKKENTNNKILILNGISINGLKPFFCALTLNFLNCKIVQMEQPGNPYNFTKNIKKNKISKINTNFIRKINTFLKKLYYVFQTFFLSLTLRDKLTILTVPARKISCKKLYPFTNLIMGSTWDFDLYLKEKDNYDKTLFKNKYALYIDGARPHIIGDEFITKQKVTITPENWYPRLNNFFDLIESEFKLEVVVAGHPKTENTGLEKRFDGRKVIFNQTKELIKNCEFITTRMSTAISYAVIYDKKIFFIQTEELFKDKYFNYIQEKYLNTFNQKALFIDGDSKKIIKKIKSHKINKSLYKVFLNQNLTGTHTITNYQIINEIFEKSNQ